MATKRQIIQAVFDINPDAANYLFDHWGEIQRILEGSTDSPRPVSRCLYHGLVWSDNYDFRYHWDQIYTELIRRESSSETN